MKAACQSVKELDLNKETSSLIGVEQD